MNECTTHHHACACREAEFKEAKSRLAEYDKNFTALQVELDQEIAHRLSVERKLKLAVKGLKSTASWGGSEYTQINVMRENAIEALAQIQKRPTVAGSIAAQLF